MHFHLGLGFTAGVTARDNWNYIPLPVLLPLASVGYGPVTFQMTYIPGTYNNGNVYFAWMRFPAVKRRIRKRYKPVPMPFLTA